MSFWIWLWKAVFVVGVAVFAVMAVWVTIQGWRDIRSLFGTLAEERGEEL
jgi:hypothetical protein